MELLAGEDVSQLIERGAFEPQLAADYVLQACFAVAEAHSLGIVHRDLKPANLFVTRRMDGTTLVKVLDFGISKSAAGDGRQLTPTQAMLGTAACISPEQMRSAGSVDARTDVWSIGTVLYELVEARRPFQADSFSEMCVMVAMDPPARMTNALDLEPIKTKLMHVASGQGWSRAKVDALDVEYRRFLYLAHAFPNEETAPTVDVATFWHSPILDTAQYSADCANTFDYFLHPDP